MSTVTKPTPKVREPISPARSTRIPGATSIQFAALGGVVFFILILVHATLRSGAPSATAPGQEIFDYVADHQARLQLGAALLALAMPAAVLWLSGLFRALRKAEGGSPALALVAFGGGILAAAGTVTGALIEGTIATRITELGPESVPVWWTMFLLTTGAWLLGLLLVIGTTAIVSLRTGLFARWFGIASVILALASAVGAFTIGYDSAGIQVVAGITILLATVWILLVSVFLYRDPTRALP